MPQSVTTSPSLSASQEDTAKAGTSGTAAQQPPIYDGWEIDQELRHIRRCLGRAAVPMEGRDEPAAWPKFRLDADHGTPAPHREQVWRTSRNTARTAAAKEHASGNRPLAILAWVTLLLGTAGFVSGLALMGWSQNVERPDLWAIGPPVILAGQIVLILGLVLQLDRSWRNGHWAAGKLEAVDEPLHDLKTAATQLGAGHGPSGKFYAHWAGGAGPEVLLSDLKSQLDLLAEKLAE